MRLINFLVSLLLLFVASFSFAQNIHIENPIQKFPKTNEGDILNFKYPLINQSKDTIYIKQPEVDCSCTEVIIPFNYLVPGEKNEIQIKFDTKHKIGWQEIVVQLEFYNSKRYKETIPVIFKGNVRATKATKQLYKEQQKQIKSKN